MKLTFLRLNQVLLSKLLGERIKSGGEKEEGSFCSTFDLDHLSPAKNLEITDIRETDPF